MYHVRIAHQMSYTFNYKSGGSNRDTFSFYYYLENKGPSRKNIIIFAKGDQANQANQANQASSLPGIIGGSTLSLYTSPDGGVKPYHTIPCHAISYQLQKGSILGVALAFLQKQINFKNSHLNKNFTQKSQRFMLRFNTLYVKLMFQPISYFRI